MGPDGHVLTFQVNHGEKLNIVAFRTDPNEWSDPNKMTKTAHRQDALDDFKGYNSLVRNLLELTEETLSVVCTRVLRAQVTSTNTNSGLFLIHATTQYQRSIKAG
jgi:RecB family endonuclease NucS